MSDDHALSLLRENLRGAYNHFDSLANTLRRDLAGVPLHPAAVLRHGWHNLGLAAKERDREMLLSKRVGGNTDQSSVGVVRKQGELHDSKSNSSVVPQSTAHNGVGKGITGVDFIARSIEEAALAEQKKRMLGHPSNSKHGIG